MTNQTDELRGTRGPYRNGIKKRQDVVEAASLVFGQYGYHGGSLRTIATLVGATAATLVAYFGSKEGLLEAVLERWRDQTSPLFSDEVGLDYYRSLIPLMRYHVKNRGLIALFLTMSTEATDPEHPARPYILARYTNSVATFRRALDAAGDLGEMPRMSSEEADAEALLAIAALDGIELQWLLNAEIDLEVTVTHFVNAAIARWTNRSTEVVAAESRAWLEERDSN